MNHRKWNKKKNLHIFPPNSQKPSSLVFVACQLSVTCWSRVKLQNKKSTMRSLWQYWWHISAVNWHGTPKRADQNWFRRLLDQLLLIYPIYVHSWRFHIPIFIRNPSSWGLNALSQGVVVIDHRVVIFYSRENVVITNFGHFHLE